MGFLDNYKKGEKRDTDSDELPNYDNAVDGEVQTGFVADNTDMLHRKLANRQIQLIAIGGSIGTALFVSIGQGLAKGGPGSLFLAYTGYSLIRACMNNGLAEMITYQPVAGGFIRLAGHWVDDALGFTAGWNFFFYEAILIPFEITALNLVLGFWSDNIPPAAIIVACIVLYALLNILAVSAYGEAEFWLSGGKVILIFLLFGFTFVTMVGGNPAGDAYGFRYWENPGSFATWISSGSLGRFEGFLAALWSAAFTVVGPEYIAMVAAEAKRPRTYIKNAFKTVYWRYAIFFIGGALCCGIVVPYDDETLRGIVAGTDTSSGAAASPYVIAMENMAIEVLPHIVNVLLITSIFSAGNTYTYCATRSLYSLSLEGRAPKFLRYTTRNGVPIWCFCVVMCFPFLAFLQVSSDASTALTWLVNLTTAAGLIDYIIISITFIFYYRATQAQGFDRKKLPYCGWFQPYCAWINLVFEILVALFFGYASFKPEWSTSTFFSNYVMVGVAPMLFVFWKFFKGTKFVKPHECDLIFQAPLIDAYEATLVGPPTGFWTEMIQLVGFKRGQKDNDKRVGEVRGRSDSTRAMSEV